MRPNGYIGGLVGEAKRPLPAGTDCEHHVMRGPRLDLHWCAKRRMTPCPRLDCGQQCRDYNPPVAADTESDDMPAAGTGRFKRQARSMFPDAPADPGLSAIAYVMELKQKGMTLKQITPLTSPQERESSIYAAISTWNKEHGLNGKSQARSASTPAAAPVSEPEKQPAPAPTTPPTSEDGDTALLFIAARGLRAQYDLWLQAEALRAEALA